MSLANEVSGKTIRLSWTDGPTKGTTQEHIFHSDGTVEWHSVGGAKKPSGSPEKPKYASEKLSDEIKDTFLSLGIGLHPDRRPEFRHRQDGRSGLKREELDAGARALRGCALSRAHQRA
jgi:hypothetical protein